MLFTELEHVTVCMFDNDLHVCCVVQSTHRIICNQIVKVHVYKISQQDYDTMACLVY